MNKRNVCGARSGTLLTILCLNTLLLAGCQSGHPVRSAPPGYLAAVSGRVTHLAGEVGQGEQGAALRYGQLLAGAGEWEQAEQILTPGAKRGDAQSQWALGQLLLQQNHRAAAGAHWVRLAAQSGIPDAQFRLSQLYAKGEGVPRDTTQAFSWAMKAAMQENASAQNDVGSAYAEGRGVSVSPPLAVEWYGRSARQGNAFAQFNLAGMYLSGRGVPENAGVAYAWYSTAQVHADGGLQLAARKYQQESLIRVSRTGRVKEAQALAAVYIQRYAGQRELNEQ